MTTTYRAQPDGIPIIDKSPNEVLDYSEDWAALGWLASGELVSSATVTVDTGLTLNTTTLSPSGAATVVTAWLAGGVVATSYLVIVKVVTNQARTGERSFRVRVVRR